MNKGDLFLSYVILFQLIAVVLQQIVALTGFVSVEQAATARVAFSVITYVPAAYIVWLRNRASLLVPFISYILFLGINYCIFPNSHAFIESKVAITLTPICILTGVYIYNVLDFNYFLKALLKVSRVCPYISLAYMLIFTLSPFKTDSYDMAFAYSMLLPTLFLFMQNRLKDTIMSLVQFVIIALVGSRGPMIIVALFYVIYILYYIPRFYLRKLILPVFILVAATTVYLPQVIDVESTRNINLFLSGEGTNDTGRGEIYDNVKSNIVDSPIVGWGIGADRDLINGYSHNFFLEIVLHYGLLGGIFIVGMLFVYMVRIFNDSSILILQGGRSFYVAMILFGFFPLFLSGSYLQDINFAFLIGYLTRFRTVRGEDLCENT